MNRLVEKYGRVAGVCIVAAIILLGLGTFGKKLYNKVYYEQAETAENIAADMRTLGEQKKYPFFCGSKYITLTLGYKGEDGIEGFSREDALSFVEAYEYKSEGEREIFQKIDKSRIKVFPFDDEKDSIREFVNVNDTGMYSVRYSVEGESGLKSDMIMMVLVDILPEGMEYRESAGADHESSS